MAEICKPLREWVKEPSEECRPCMLAPLTRWYRDLLMEKGFQDLAKEVDGLAEKSDVSGEDVADLLDHIKSKVPLEVAQTLQEYDCTVQAMEEDMAKGESGNGS